ncbi:hypothetical protein GCM10027280_17970 [Micromonospora polyrhachis]|uniref:Uncharacterized protein n=1 Tax=Micromonospora polyrhachis TaxID=1282883 RepID=A0A7W7SNN2_9ACTN|nr:hypothetical protein [Micromonospora polyrhachis]MBB4956895.1 hypothetical protein [Micromonospora polyrhachis]
MVPIALARPLWGVVRRSLRMLTGLAMATIVLALTAGVWQATASGGLTSASPDLATMPVVQVTDVVLVSDPIEVDQRLGIGQRLGIDQGSGTEQTGDRLPGDERADRLAAPLRLIERPAWTPIWEPDADPYPRPAGPRGPPRR